MKLIFIKMLSFFYVDIKTTFLVNDKETDTSVICLETSTRKKEIKVFSLDDDQDMEHWILLLRLNCIIEHSL